MLHPIDLLHAQTLISLIQFGLDPVGFLAAVGAAAFRRALPQALRKICRAFVRHVAISRVISSGIRQDARAFGRLPGVGATTSRPLTGRYSRADRVQEVTSAREDRRTSAGSRALRCIQAARRSGADGTTPYASSARSIVGPGGAERARVGIPAAASRTAW